jgi:hypothetical protein
MKNVNELDDFLRQKEEEFNVPYKEEYWDKASAFLNAERGASSGRRTLAGIALLSSAVIISIALIGYFVFNYNSNHKAETAVSATVSSSASKSISGNSGNNNATINGATSTNNNGATIANITPASVTGTIKTQATNSGAVKPSSPQITSSVKTGSRAKHNSINPMSGRYVATQVVSGGVENPDVTSRTGNTAMSPVNNQQSPYISSPFESQIPEFENMTINDKTIAVLYGLYYKSDGTAAYKKTHEVAHSAMFPQLGIALTGGANIFNSFRDNKNPYAYVSTNPFLGVKATYQWNSNWLAIAQLNGALRGGVNQQITELPSGSAPLAQTYSVRHLYYLQLPIMLGYQISKKNMVSAGVGISYLLSDGVQAKDSSGRYEGSYKMENGNGFNKLDYFAALAYTYRLNRRFSFSINATYGFTDVTNTSYFDDAIKNYNHNISLGLAINYSLLQRKIGE